MPPEIPKYRIPVGLKFMGLGINMMSQTLILKVRTEKINNLSVKIG